jgi:hypothetical protein
MYISISDEKTLFIMIFIIHRFKPVVYTCRVIKHGRFLIGNSFVTS